MVRQDERQYKLVVYPDRSTRTIHGPDRNFTYFLSMQQDYLTDIYGVGPISRYGTLIIMRMVTRASVLITPECKLSIHISVAITPALAPRCPSKLAKSDTSVLPEVLCFDSDIIINYNNNNNNNIIIIIIIIMLYSAGTYDIENEKNNEY